jgi:hypothetical protein
MHSLSLYRSMATSAAVLALLACGEPTSTSGTPAVSFSIATAEQLAGASTNRAVFATSASGALVIGVGTDTLVIDSVRVVLAQVTLAKTGQLCGVDGHDDAADPDCASISTGPFIVKLPLTSGVLSLFDVPIPAGTYNRLAVRVHKPNHTNSGPNVEAFLAAHPEWLNKSAMVDGTFNGVAFHWAHDPPIQLNHTFEPPLVISADGSNFTLSINVDGWFRASSGVLINPGAPTNVLYPQIAANVANSFKLFRDNTKKGHDDGK